MAYNRKINLDGSYRDFHGYTVLSMVKENMQEIEIFLRQSPLSEYFSPLPSYTYHMTVFNIWAHGGRFLPSMKKKFDELVGQRPDRRKKILEYCKGETSRYFCFEDDLFPQLNEADKTCRFIDGDFKVDVELFLSPSTLSSTVAVKNKNSQQGLGGLQKKCSGIFGKAVDLKFHITFAYRYKDIPESAWPMLGPELEKLNKKLEPYRELTLLGPKVYFFTSMDNYYYMREGYF